MVTLPELLALVGSCLNKISDDELEDYLDDGSATDGSSLGGVGLRWSHFLLPVQAVPLPTCTSCPVHATC